MLQVVSSDRISVRLACIDGANVLMLPQQFARFAIESIPEEVYKNNQPMSLIVGELI